jgi:acyl-CoA reductase-like NAD-dependent aldehyde dehydrogenase
MSAPETLSEPAVGTPDLPGDVTTLPVGGDWVALPSAGAIVVEDPSLERPIGSVPAVTAEGVDRAVRAAHAAAPGWAAWPSEARAGVLERIADGLGAEAEALAVLVAREVGTPVAIAAAVQVALPVAVLQRAAGEARALVRDEPAGAARVSYEPAGVVAAITPWNFPLHQIAAKVGFALAAGCAVVLKPSEVAPFNALALAGIAARAGLPPGVLNVVTGTGPEAGEALVGHPLVDVVSLTGSVGAGRRVGAIAGDGLKRVALELGGKSASVVLEDADLERAVRHGIGRGFLNSGQACNAATRILVPRDRLAEAEEIAADETGRLVVGPALDAATTMGPVVSATQRERVLGHVRAALDAGARTIAGGPERPGGLDVGHFVAPTVFADVDPALPIAREEVFGPVLCLLGHDGEEDAVARANDTRYGLSAELWTADPERARRVAARLRAGQVKVNGASTRDALDAPFGGRGDSGVGRELGRWGLHEFLEAKAVIGVG